ncbi:MAG: pilY2 [Paucimonas sp.]|nr:pilY2 [Paucimonas sp.]
MLQLRIALAAALGLLLPVPAAAATFAAVDLAQTPFDARVAVSPLLLLALEGDAGTALASSWPDDYQPAREYEGYFDHRKCYRFNGASRGYFIVDSNAGAGHGCDGGYSGNFMNWASMTALDSLRYGLFGGYRAADSATATVLERVDVGSNGPVPQGLRKMVRLDQPALGTGRPVPFDVPALFIQSCGIKLLLSEQQLGGYCERAAGERLLAELPVRVKVCDEEKRPWLCTSYGAHSKPEGELQRASSWLKFGLSTGVANQVAAVAAGFIGPIAPAPDSGLPQANAGKLWNRASGVLGAEPSARDSLLQQLLRWPGSGSAGATGAAYRQALDYLGSTGGTGPVMASCQANTVLNILATGTRDAAASPGTGSASAMGGAPERILAMETDTGASFGNPLPSTSAQALSMSPTGLALAGLAWQANLGTRWPATKRQARTSVLDIGRTPADYAASPFYLAAKYGGFIDTNQDGNPFRASPPPQANWPDTEQVEWDRNMDGLADSYQAAADGTQLLAGLRRLFRQLRRDAESAVAPLAAPLALGQGDALFVASHETLTWSGALRRYQLARGADAALTRETAAAWTASLPEAGERAIYTAVSAGTPAAATVALQWNNLSEDQRQALDLSPETGRPDGLGANRLTWLRAARLPEEGNGGLLRRRLQALGGFVQGGLVGHIAADGTGHLFAGANDGLLHAFDAATGAEVFAWLPASLLPKVPQLTAPDGAQQAFVDGGLDLATLDFAGGRKTVLAGSFGRGGTGVFALDVTTPGRFGNSGGAMFEFTDADHAGIGHVIGAPRIVRLASRSASGDSERSFLLAHAGINSEAALYLLALDKLPSQAWSEGVNFHRLPAAGESVAQSFHLGAPALVTGNDGRLLHAYAGDLNGNLWRFSFAPDARSPLGFTTTVQRILHAVDSDGRALPISAAPRVAHANDGGYVVLLGSGKWLEHRDAAPASARTESLFAVHDRPGVTRAATRAALKPRRAVAVNGGGFRVTGDAFNFDGTVRGWVLDLPQQGERITQAPVLAGGRVLFSSMLLQSDPCLASGSRLWQLDVMSGLSASPTGQALGRALLRTPVVIQSGGVAAASDAFGRRASGRTWSVLFQEPAAGLAEPDARMAEQGPAGRLSWREIGNWDQLREQARAR